MPLKLAPASGPFRPPITASPPDGEPGARRQDLRRAVLAANYDGLYLLRHDRTAAAFEQLKHAEAVLTSNPAAAACDGELLALTCSNLGCYYRKAGLPRSALSYLGRALQVEETAWAGSSPQDTCSLAVTKLNACAALSGVGNHEEAEELAAEAARSLLPPLPPGEVRLPPDNERNALLAVACHNLGAEREHLGLWDEAAVAYRQGAEAACKTLGPGSALAKALVANCAEALEKAGRHPTTPDRRLTPRPPPGGLRRRWLRQGWAATPRQEAPERPAGLDFCVPVEVLEAALQAGASHAHEEAEEGDEGEEEDEEPRELPELAALPPTRSTRQKGLREQSLEQWGQLFNVWSGDRRSLSAQRHSPVVADRRRAARAGMPGAAVLRQPRSSRMSLGGPSEPSSMRPSRVMMTRQASRMIA